MNNKRHLHFIGIGGSGMYPLAQILHEKGFYITGSDNNETDTLQAEREMGIPIFLGHSPENIKGADLIVHTAAILPDNVELVAAKKSGVPVIERSELLGLITKHYNRCICVSGTHGKTTTTSMLTQILMEGNLDPTAVVGGKLPIIGGSGRVGKSDLMVCEACEFVDTFLKLYPDISIILNIDADHLDYFGTVENIIKSFHKFAQATTKTIIINGDNENAMKAVEGVEKEIITFGLRESNDYYPQNIIYQSGIHTEFDLMHRGEKLMHIELHIPGHHNILNAIAAAAAALICGASKEAIVQSFKDFGGAKRRFEVLYKGHGITVADDYAHHPTEIRATLTAAKEMPFKRVWAVHQPFTYSRTALLLDDFAEVLSIADKVVLSEIMGSREVNTYNIYAKDLAEKIDGCVWFKTFEEIADYVVDHAEEGDLIITLGCGDVNKCAHMIKEKLQNKD